MNLRRYTKEEKGSAVEYICIPESQFVTALNQVKFSLEILKLIIRNREEIHHIDGLPPYVTFERLINKLDEICGEWQDIPRVYEDNYDSRN